MYHTRGCVQAKHTFAKEGRISSLAESLDAIVMQYPFHSGEGG